MCAVCLDMVNRHNSVQVQQAYTINHIRMSLLEQYTQQLSPLLL
jgi:hypothetical protein